LVPAERVEPETRRHEHLDILVGTQTQFRAIHRNPQAE
jgi:hypothetical protein